MTKPFPPKALSWALFLDRDGVINERIPGEYLKDPKEFTFTKNAKEAIALLSSIFRPMIVVTNQQGIGKGLMNEEQLIHLHEYMLDEVKRSGGQLDAVFYCPFRAEDNHPDRKPNIGMAQKAKAQFPEIDFQKAMMVGDSESDILFGKALGMKTVFIGPSTDIPKFEADQQFESLSDFALWIDLHKKNVLL